MEQLLLGRCVCSRSEDEVMSRRQAEELLMTELQYSRERVLEELSTRRTQISQRGAQYSRDRVLEGLSTRRTLRTVNEAPQYSRERVLEELSTRRT